VIEFERLLQAGTLAENFAGALLIGIETGVGNLSLQFVELTLPGINVKETSALPRYAS